MPIPREIQDRDDLLTSAITEAERARGLFPQPSPVLLALVEEAGEIVKACLDYRQGRAVSADILKEVVQTIAMCLRLAQEGDPINGVPRLLEEVFE